jgi:S-formylglutathione hydrolase
MTQSVPNKTQLIKQQACFGGWQQRYQHHAQTLHCEMTVSVYLPPHAAQQKVPSLYWLSGLTCTDENFVQKAGAQRMAAELGIAIICPDTSPRGTDLPGEHDSYDLGSGAGFYINTTQAPWAAHYQMYDYVSQELIEWAEKTLPITPQRSISGHSMGGHGALICALKNPQRYLSVSAFAPICHPSACAWGQKAFSSYLGTDTLAWKNYDAVELLAHARERLPLLIEQGLEDEFLPTQLHLKTLISQAEKYHHPITVHQHPHYDHSYFFIAAFIEHHLRYHAKALLTA